MSTQIQCPNCGSYRTSPYTGDGSGGFMKDIIGVFGKLKELSTDSVGFENPENIRKFETGKIGAYCADCKFKFDVNTSPKRPSMSIRKSSTSSETGNIEERLSQLEQLRKKNLITEEEYKQKREELLRSL